MRETFKITTVKKVEWEITATSHQVAEYIATLAADGRHIRSDDGGPIANAKNVTIEVISVVAKGDEVNITSTEEKPCQSSQ